MSEITHSYFCPYCALKYDSFEVLKSHVLEQHKAQPLPTPEGQIHLIISTTAQDF